AETISSFFSSFGTVEEETGIDFSCVLIGEGDVETEGDVRSSCFSLFREASKERIRSSSSSTLRFKPLE
ncbi:hypothetical protein, partial [Leptospira ellisii]|uniref:hypothetical protein n=1 Tax=Leptospira ellisii TaxID=2023197 RepID=UPI0013FDD2F6